MPKKTGSRPHPKGDKSSNTLHGDTLSLSNIEQLKAIADPLRQRLLEQFSHKPSTTKQVADRLGLKPTRLYHHVAKLERAGLVRLVETRPVRGTTEKYYAAAAGRLEIDRSAFAGSAAQSARKLAGLQVIDSLLGNVRDEVADYLDEDTRPTADEPASEQEVMFGQAELCADAATAAIYRNKLSALLAECESSRTAGKESGDGATVRKYRLVVGWYPMADKS